MSKNKNKKKVVGAADDFDDLDAILAAETAKNLALNPEPIVEATITPPAPPPAAATVGGGDDDDDDDDDDAVGGDVAKDKKKKKKKPKKKEEEKKPVEKQLSATAKAVLQRQAAIAEEQARLDRIREEKERKIREEEEAEANALKAAEDEKERRRLAKQAKVDASKAAGTYMTKAEKERVKKQQAKLEMMKASGLIPSGATATGSDAADATTESTPGTAKVVYGGKKKKPSSSSSKESTTQQETVDVKEPVVVLAAAATISKDVVASVDGDDDWESETFDNVEKVVIPQSVASHDDGSEEDDIDLDNKKEKEKLKELGLARAKREEELRLKRLEEEKELEEMERKEREALVKKESSRKKRTERDEIARKARTPQNLRSPISCIMGHVDTGKTKLLDKIRHTNVQEGEAGGITQQIGATQFSRETLIVQTNSMQRSQPFDILIPGLLMIDTPGHESFTNLRSRGSSLCDIAILVIDLMHGLEQQTIESINLLKRKRTPFVVALNKVDRCYGWKSMPDSPIQEALAAQDENCRLEFKSRAESAIVQLMEQGLNAKLYWDNDDLARTVSLVPTSAISGEGVPDLLKMVITLTQTRLQEQLMFMDVLQCTVLEVKAIDGLGTTVDVVLVNGTLREGDTIVVSTMEGPVVTSIRALLTPPPNREMRVKNEYVHHEMLKGAIGIKIVATDIGRAIAGTPVLVIHPDDDIEDVKEDVQSDLTKVLKALETESKGVSVHASTLGALEALLQFLREECKPKIPVSHISIGPIYKKDVVRASIMHEKGSPEFATILAFDVRVDSEAAAMAEENNVRIFTADIIYHLFDQFSAYINGITAGRKKEAEAIVNFPCVLKILPQFIFNKKDPIVFGVEVVEGALRLGTLLTIPSLQLDVGRVTSIEANHREATVAKKGTSVSIKIDTNPNTTLTFGRQFDESNALYSKISRASIDALKEYYKDDMTKDDWNLVIKLKKVFNIS